MTPEELDTAFKDAVETINKHDKPFPADFLLRLYAYYKIATNNRDTPNSTNPLINAFKTNALFQNRNMSTSQAKEKYIEAVKHYLLYRK